MVSSEATTSDSVAAKDCCRLVSDLKGEPAGDSFSLTRLVLLPLGIVALLTLIIRLSGLDLTIQEDIYRAGGETWDFGERGLWKLLYEFGTIPALLVFILSLAGIVLGSYRESWRGWRRVFIFNVLLFAMGPGVITNGILKEYWGRPRPREVQGMGGHHQFEAILTIDRSSDGKSFPCGHATMGFYFLGTFFLLRRHRRRLAEAVLWGAIAYGSLIGIARMAKGGHFLSDVVWAFAVCYFTALGIYYALKLNRSLWRPPEQRKAMSWWFRIAIVIASLAVISGLVLATPYRAVRDYYLLDEYSDSIPYDLLLMLKVGEHEIISGEEIRVTGEAYGHGVPTSRVAEVFWEGIRQEAVLIQYKERLSGWLSEVNQQLEFEVPWERVRFVTLEVGEASVWCHLGDVKPETVFKVNEGQGTVTFKKEGRNVNVIGGAEGMITGLGKTSETFENGSDDRIKIEVGEGFQGQIRLED